MRRSEFSGRCDLTTRSRVLSGLRSTCQTSGPLNQRITKYRRPDWPRWRRAIATNALDSLIFHRSNELWSSGGRFARLLNLEIPKGNKTNNSRHDLLRRRAISAGKRPVISPSAVAKNLIGGSRTPMKISISVFGAVVGFVGFAGLCGLRQAWSRRVTGF